MRVVLTGASNLSMALPRVINSACAALGAPLEFFVATGFGRSYGQESKFFWKKFSGILPSEMWPALERSPARPTVAIVADVGNDLAYEAPVDTVHDWVTTTLDRLAKHDARIVLNNLPLASFRAVGPLRFCVMRAALFPRCLVPRDELLRRAAALSEALGHLAENRKIPAFSAENSWYGLDPIHPRRRCAGIIWQQMITSLAPQGATVPWRAPSRADARQLLRMRSSDAHQRGRRGSSESRRVTLSDGSTVELF